jgi:hypothetical protein
MDQAMLLKTVVDVWAFDLEVSKVFSKRGLTELNHDHFHGGHESTRPSFLHSLGHCIGISWNR